MYCPQKPELLGTFTDTIAKKDFSTVAEISMLENFPFVWIHGSTLDCDLKADI